MTKQELDQYILAFKNGDEEAFTEIYQETYQSVYYTIYLLTKNLSIIDDYVQDTYLQVINKLSSYQIGTNFKAWICRIAHNLTINGLLKSVKEIPLELSRATEHVFGPAPKKDDRIDKALDLLEGEEKELFIHLIIEGFSVKETADMMNVNINRIYYLRKKMETNLKIIMEKY